MTPETKIGCCLLFALLYALFVMFLWMAASLHMERSLFGIDITLELLVVATLACTPLWLVMVATENGRKQREQHLRGDYTLISKYRGRL